MNPHIQFWSLLRRQPDYNSAYKDELKAMFVWQWSGEKTESLNEFYKTDPYRYKSMLMDMRNRALSKASNTIKSLRSQVLRLLDQIGVDTSGTERGDWEVINGYLSSPRIAGKKLNAMSIEELESCIGRLRMIKSKGCK